MRNELENAYEAPVRITSEANEASGRRCRWTPLSNDRWLFPSIDLPCKEPRFSNKTNEPAALMSRGSNSRFAELLGPVLILVVLPMATNARDGLVDVKT